VRSVQAMDEQHVTDVLGASQPTESDRTAACGREIAEVLRRHGCMIVPRVSLEQVGAGASGRFLLSAEYGVVAIQN